MGTLMHTSTKTIGFLRKYGLITVSRSYGELHTLKKGVESS